MIHNMFIILSCDTENVFSRYYSKKNVEDLFGYQKHYIEALMTPYGKQKQLSRRKAK